MVDQATLDKIRAAVDIAEVVGEYVPLRKAGPTSWKGLCPFHREKTPSFTVNGALQIFKCFGCGVGGNVFTFLSRIEGVPFPEAVSRLAERAKIPLPTAPASPADRERDRIRQVLETAAALYQRSLAKAPEAERARRYLAERAVPPAAAAAFRIGYCTGRELLDAKLHPTLLRRAGLAVEGRNGLADRMRGRLVLPIADDRGRVIGFGGRALEANHEPKYLNTAETPVFKKSATLYALHAARDAIRSAGRAILVEGYFDAIALHAHGIREAVATLGTALTETQLRALKRLARGLAIVYDEDVGGNEAAVRGLDLATEAGFEVRIVRLPGGADPDEFVNANGRDAFLRALDEAAGSSLSLFDYRLEVALRRDDPATLAGKRRIVASLLPYLARVPDAIERFAYVRRLADRLDLREADIEEELKKVRAAGPSAPASRSVPAADPRVAPASSSPAWRAERLLLEGALRHRPAAVQALLDLPPEAFPSKAGGRLAARLREWIESGEGGTVASLVDEFREDPVAVELLASAAAETGPDADDAVYREAAAHLARLHGRLALRRIQRELERTTDPETAVRLLAEKQQLAAARRP